MTSPYAYQLNDIRFSYENIFSLQIDNLQIRQGMILGIIGHNGSGKTTLLKILSFLLSPSFGQIKYFDQVVNKRILPVIKRQTALLLQETILLNRTVFENVVYGLKIRKDTKELTGRAAKVLEIVSFNSIDFLAKKAQQLSGGEAKRVALASRIILTPRVLLLDEPFAHIDKQSKQLISNVLINLAATGHTIVFSSHNLSEINSIANNIIELKQGKVL